MGNKRVGLALGGGVGRGVAHLGVLRALTRAKIPVDMVAGTSAGALTGGLFCAGLELDRLMDQLGTLRWSQFARLTWPHEGFLSLEPLENFMNTLMGGERLIESLQIPFAAVATDLETGLPSSFRAGSLARAVRASSSVPGFAVPTEIAGKRYGDGGISNNLPVDVLREMGADIVIGVDLFSPNPNPPLGPFGWLFYVAENLVRRVGGGVNIADCLIVPRIAGTSYLRFSNAEEMVQRGEAAVEERLEDLTRLLAGR